ncbi:MAG: methyltransferase domain-containing protein [Candidatus Hodarchaeota archaeon]
MKKKQKYFFKFHSQLDLPFLETSNESLKEIFQILELEFGLKRNSNQKLVDLGAGNGNIVIFSALYYGIKSYGIEIDQSLIKEAKKRIKSLEKKANFDNRLFRKIKIKFGDFYLHNLKKYDFIYIFSLPPMQKYLKHLFSTAKRGAVIISHKYQLSELNSLLKYEYTLAYKKNKQEIFTFLYRKVS